MLTLTKKITREIQVIACDFDDTIGEYVNGVLEIKSMAISVLTELQRNGVEIILWTCRKGDTLREAVEACRAAGLEFDAVNENAPRHMQRWLEAHPEDVGQPQSPKVYADLYLDDHSRFDGEVDWARLRFELLG